MEQIVTLQDYNTANKFLEDLNEQKKALERDINRLDFERSRWLNTPDLWGKLEKFGSHPGDAAVLSKVLEIVKEKKEDFLKKAEELLSELKDVKSSHEQYNFVGDVKCALEHEIKEETPVVKTPKEPMIDKVDEILSESQSVGDELIKSIQQLIPLLTKLVENKLTT